MGKSLVKDLAMRAILNHIQATVAIEKIHQAILVDIDVIALGAGFSRSWGWNKKARASMGRFGPADIDDP